MDVFLIDPVIGLATAQFLIPRADCDFLLDFTTNALSLMLLKLFPPLSLLMSSLYLLLKPSLPFSKISIRFKIPPQVS